jgi:hypothetical protein
VGQRGPGDWAQPSPVASVAARLNQPHRKQSHRSCGLSVRTRPNQPQTRLPKTCTASNAPSRSRSVASSRPRVRNLFTPRSSTPRPRVWAHERQIGTARGGRWTAIRIGAPLARVARSASMWCRIFEVHDDRPRAGPCYRYEGFAGMIQNRRYDPCRVLRAGSPSVPTALKESLNDCLRPTRTSQGSSGRAAR